MQEKQYPGGSDWHFGLIGLMVENLIFRVVEIRTVQCWGMQHWASAGADAASSFRVARPPQI
jgi:hypothetical protein